MELREHQKKAVEESPNKWGLWFRMRVGKTPTAIRLATSRCKSAIVICPKGLVKQWKSEIEVWSDNHKVDFMVISRDQFKLKFKIEKVKRGRKFVEVITGANIKKYDAIIVDECHRGFGNYKSIMFKCLDYYIKRYNIGFIWLLSGTPLTAKSWSIYSYGKLLGKKWLWNKWNNFFFKQVQMGIRRIPVARDNKDDDLRAIIKSIGTVVDLKDVAEVADDIDVYEYFKLNKRQKDEIKALDEDVPVVEYMKQHQLEQGVLNSDGYREELQFKCAKDDRLIEIAANYEKIIIVCKYKAQIRKLIKLFKNRSLHVIWGESKEESSVIAKRADAEDNCIVIIQNDTCDGYDLKSFDTMVFASMAYSFINYDQVKSRMKSMVKGRANTYIHLLTEGNSIDQAVADTINKKQTFSLKLYAKERLTVHKK